MKKIFLSGFILASFSLFAQQLDPSFGEQGIVTHNFYSGNYEIANALAIQSDGKFVVGGDYSNGSYDHPVVMRFNADGSPDNSFDTDGKVELVFEEGYAGCKDVLIDADGKIIVAGYYDVNFVQTLFVAKLNADGSLDNSFASDGIFEYEVSEKNVGATQLIMQGDKILVLGEFDALSNADLLLLRLNANGTLDNSFNSTGMNVIDLGNYEYSTSVKFQSDGKIIVGGYSAVVEPSGFVSSKFIALRLTANGTLDNTFGDEGIAEITNGTFLLGLNILVLADDKVLATALSGEDLDLTHSTLIRLNANGTLDEGFGTNGFVQKNYSEFGDELISLSITSDNKILSTGALYTENSENFIVAAFNADGSDVLGSSPLISDLEGVDYLGDALLQGDGKLVSVGIADEETDGQILITRFSNIISSINKKQADNIVLAASPNPVLDKSTVSYTLSASDVVRISVLNAQGVVVQSLVEEESRSAGDHQQIIDLHDQMPGLYTVLVDGHTLHASVKLIKR